MSQALRCVFRESKFLSSTGDNYSFLGNSILSTSLEFAVVIVNDFSGCLEYGKVHIGHAYNPF